jgi:hypothetical protein
MDVRSNGRGVSAGPATPVRKLPVSRKARHPRMTRVESAVLVILIAGLSVVVFVGVSGATRSGTIAQCDANANALTAGITALREENAGPFPTTSGAWNRALLSSTLYVGGPFITRWPSSPSYVMLIAGIGSPIDNGDRLHPRSGDVLVISQTHRVFDATVNLGSACGVT